MQDREELRLSHDFVSLLVSRPLPRGIKEREKPSPGENDGRGRSEAVREEKEGGKQVMPDAELLRGIHFDTSETEHAESKGERARGNCNLWFAYCSLWTVLVGRAVRDGAPGFRRVHSSIGQHEAPLKNDESRKDHDDDPESLDACQVYIAVPSLGGGEVAPGAPSWFAGADMLSVLRDEALSMAVALSRLRPIHRTCRACHHVRGSANSEMRRTVLGAEVEERRESLSPAGAALDTVRLSKVRDRASHIMRLSFSGHGSVWAVSEDGDLG